MFYCTYRGRAIDVLKCSRCRSYSIRLDPVDAAFPQTDSGWIQYRHKCDKCGAEGSVRISSEVNLEGFETWEELQDRIEELRIVMSLTALEKPQDSPGTNNSH